MFDAVPADPSLIRLNEDVTIETKVFLLKMDQGTEWELPLHIAVPATWDFSSDGVGFTNGSSSIMLTTGCAGPCVAKSWDIVLAQDGQYLDWAARESGDSGMSFGSGSNADSGYSTIDAPNEDGTGTSLTARYDYRGARFVGCEAIAQPGDVDLDTLAELCEKVRPDWTTVVANTPPVKIEQVLTDSAAAIVADPAPGVARQIVALDDDESANTVSIALPADASFETDTFGTEVDLGDDWSIFSDLSLDGTCGGACQAKDWEAKLNGGNGQLGRGRARVMVENDAAIDSGWVQSGVVVDDDEHHVIVVRWNDDVDRYFSCTADLDDDDAHRADEILAICLSAEPSWFEIG